MWRPLAVLSEGVCDRVSQERVQSFHHILEEDLTKRPLPADKGELSAGTVGELETVTTYPDGL